MVANSFTLEKLRAESSTSEESRPLPRHHPRCLKAYKIPIGKDDWFKKFQIWWWLWKNRNLIEQADIVHAHDVGFWYFPFRLVYPRKPFYITFHGYEKYPPSEKAILIRKISEKLAWGNICVGDYIPKWYRTKASYVTYGGTDVLSIKHKVSSIKKDGKIRLVFVGRLEEENGIKMYLRALDMLEEREIEYEITFLGYGSYEKEASKYGIVRLIHSNDTYHYSELLRRADFVFASSYLSILEALAAKKLVFAIYDNPLKEDYLKMAPFAKWIVIEGSPEGLYNKLIYYTQYPKEEKRMLEEAYNWVKEQTWEKVTDLYLRLWGTRGVKLVNTGG